MIYRLSREPTKTEGLPNRNLGWDAEARSSRALRRLHQKSLSSYPVCRAIREPIGDCLALFVSVSVYWLLVLGGLTAHIL